MPPLPDVQLGPLTRSILDGAPWRDVSVFPASQHWADEVERVLSFLTTQGVFARFLPRLRARETERDGALAEARTGYYFHRNGFQVLKWEPEEVAGRPGDLDIRWSDSEAIFVEVKGPGWEGELTPEEIAAGRQHQPKYINAEARAMDPVERVIYAVDKALPKLSSERINVVVVADDLFFSPTEIPKTLLLGRLATMLRDEVYRNVGGIFMLNAVSYTEGTEVEYRARFIANVNATRPLPDAVQSGLLGTNDNPYGPRRDRE
jgi:hypothetical protein